MRNKFLRQPGQRWNTPIWSSINATQWYVDRKPTKFHVPGGTDQFFSSRYNAFYQADAVVCAYRRIFITGGNNIQSGGNYTRPSWGTKAVNDALAGLRGVVQASLYDGMRWGNMNPNQTALKIAYEVAKCWQPKEANHLMSIIETEMCNRGML